MKGFLEVLSGGPPGRREFESMEEALTCAVGEAKPGYRGHIYEGSEPRWSVRFEEGAVALYLMRRPCRSHCYHR